jgi:hypothetical protein
MPFDLDPKYIETTEAKVLRDAAAYIEEHGWCQNRLGNSAPYDVHGPVCVGGAFMRVLDTDYLPLALCHPAARAFEKYVDRSYVGFNDTPGRTKEDVIAALNGAADMSEKTP